GVMAIIDPRRDVEVYLSLARKNNMRITHIIDTHVHADHVSGAQQLRAATAADIYIHQSAPIKYEAKKLAHGDEFKLGNAFMRILHTPGHTADSVSVLISDLARSPQPEMILTGDLLFIGDIGRPDLPGDEILDEQIANLYHSLHQTLGELPQYLEVYPGHGQGSLCGQGIGAKPSSTVGYEWLTNPMLQHLALDEFKKAIMANLPMRPQSFASIIRGNKDNVLIIPPYEDLSKYALTVDEVKELTKNGVSVLDLRDGMAFAAAHIPGSIHVDAAAGTMLNWIGIAVAAGTPLVLVLPTGKKFEEIRLELQRIGYDQIKGWLKGGLSAWVEQGLATQSFAYLSATELGKLLAGTDIPILLDVRSAQEFDRTSIDGSINRPFARILAPDSCADLAGKKVVVVCQSGFRSSIAASLLQTRGCSDIGILAGGLGAWKKAFAK
ncbi:MAG: rhodanese-like domain-containing protein, partial [Dehalococcoidia bacterium]|nr:rhodanese-like domain-containing protein [Dehalococcoidia bacterium]